jgi:peptidoglycan-N-acetylglucosamine deacetylase
MVRMRYFQGSLPAERLVDGGAMTRLLVEKVSQLLGRLATAVHKRDLAEVLAGRATVNHRHRDYMRLPFQRVRGMSKPRVLLTFDDGPHPINTPKVLDELRHAGVQATFFVMGKKLETSLGQELIHRAAAEGHQIGNHTYSHPNLTELAEDQIREEILKTEQLIGDVSGGVKILRPPYGAHNSLVDQVAKELGYSLILWTVDTRDWYPDYDDRWVAHAMGQIVTQEQSIVLAHDNQHTTGTRVGTLIAQIRKLSGSRFVRYSEVFP